ncbi:MAG: helix-turn-helix transcriptional regulator [Gemmataceae bacterium]|nr:helix-turn-helix transcriptional regulator [Gemmataceae bacterium]
MRKSRRSVCPIACALDVFGDRWTLLVIRDLAAGRSLFSEFTRSPEKIATNILTDRLHKLTTHGLVEKTEDAYRLTPKGQTLLPVLRTIGQWGLTHLPGTEARISI